MYRHMHAAGGKLREQSLSVYVRTILLSPNMLPTGWYQPLDGINENFRSMHFLISGHGFGTVIKNHLQQTSTSYSNTGVQNPRFKRIGKSRILKLRGVTGGRADAGKYSRHQRYPTLPRARSCNTSSEPRKQPEAADAVTAARTGA